MPDKKLLCSDLKDLIRDEIKAWQNYRWFLDRFLLEAPEDLRDFFRRSIIEIYEDEASHARILERLYEALKCS